jgi:transcriptional regulator with XRE-family HTH domain
MTTALANSLNLLDSDSAFVQQTQLGALLRQARNRAQLTLQEVAAVAGISYSALSKIENGQVEIKFATLMRLSKALSLSVPVLGLSTDNSEPQAAGKRVVTTRGRGIKHRNKQYHYELLCSELIAKSMLPSVITVKARRLEDFSEWNRHAGEELIYVLKGKVRLHLLGYQPLLLNTGDTAYYDSTIGHALVSVGKQLAEVLSVAVDAKRSVLRKIP